MTTQPSPLTPTDPWSEVVELLMGLGVPGSLAGAAAERLIEVAARAGVRDSHEVSNLESAGVRDPEPTPMLHPDDGHEHWYGCHRCGVDAPEVLPAKTPPDPFDWFMDLRLDGPAAEGWTYQQTARHYAAIIAAALAPKEPQGGRGVSRFAYADPPYPGQSAKHYADHPDFAGEVDHGALLLRLDGSYDGWVLHTASTTLSEVLGLAAEHRIDGFRVMAWVKPFAAFKRNVSVAYAWEPVLVKPVRKPVVSGRVVMRDWLAESITLRRGLTGAKPERVCHWLFEVAGLDPADSLVDLFPGSGAVTRAWDSWRASLSTPADEKEPTDGR